MNANAPPHTSLWSDLRRLPRSYWILFSGTLINRFGHFVIPFLALYLKREGHEAWVTGASLAAYGAGGLLANLLGGWCADRMGRKPTILFSCVSAALSMLALSQVHAAASIVALSGVVGLASAMYFPAASALLADLIPVELRLRAFSCQRLAVNFGFALGMMTAGAMAAHSFLWLFVIDAGTTALLGLLVHFGVPAGRKASTANAGWGVALRAMRSNSAFLRAVFASFCIAMVFWQLSSTWGLHVTMAGGHDEKTYGWLMALNGLMIITLELPLTSFTRRFAAPRMMAVGYLLVGAGIGLSAFGGSMPLLVAVMVLLTFGEMMSLPVAHGFVASLAPDDMRGRFMGVFGVSWSAATMIGPAAGLALFEFSPALLWLGCFGLGALAAASVVGCCQRGTQGESAAAPAIALPEDAA